MNLKQIAEALKEAAKWAEWELESINDFHEYAQRFGGTPGGNVFTYVLRDALRFRGLTLEQFREMRRQR